MNSEQEELYNKIINAKEEEIKLLKEDKQRKD